jgi:hypothetical protein
MGIWNAANNFLAWIVLISAGGDYYYACPHWYGMVDLCFMWLSGAFLCIGLEWYIERTKPFQKREND